MMLVWQFGPGVRADNELHKPQFRSKSSVDKQILTSEAHATGANISTGHVLAGASVHARVGFTLVVVDVAVFATPARITKAIVARRKAVIMSVRMHLLDVISLAIQS